MVKPTCPPRTQIAKNGAVPVASRDDPPRGRAAGTVTGPPESVPVLGGRLTSSVCDALMFSSLGPDVMIQEWYLVVVMFILDVSNSRASPSTHDPPPPSPAHPGTIAAILASEGDPAMLF